MFRIIPLLSLLLFFFLACTAKENKKEASPLFDKDTIITMTDTATFGAGCFWCVEAVFQQLIGVEKVESGYSGGDIKNPTYREISSGRTGHVEVVRIVYDPEKITFDELLEVFWKTHDPTSLNRQGADVGTQYRSVIFYHNDEQKRKAEDYKKTLNEQKVFDKPLVTSIEPLKEFYSAEDYHQNYYSSNPEYPYCRIVIQPKLEKMTKVFAEKLKK